MAKIPKIIHQIWIGPKKMPIDLMNSWKEKNPTFEHRIWTDNPTGDQLPIPGNLVNQRKIDQIEEFAGKADIIRYELLKRFGGFYADADSRALKPLEDYFFERDSFAVFENETVRGNLVANGYIGATKNNELMTMLVNGISKKKVSQKETGLMAWQTVGPLYFTETIMQHSYSKIDIFPSWIFIPKHYTGATTLPSDETPICEQYWGSTRELSDPEFYNKLT